VPWSAKEARERAARFVTETLGFANETVIEVDYGRVEKDRTLRDLIATDVALYVSDPERGRTRRYSYDRIRQRPDYDRPNEYSQYHPQTGGFMFWTYRVAVYRGPGKSSLQRGPDFHHLVDVRSSDGRLPRFVLDHARWDGLATPESVTFKGVDDGSPEDE
jgi:hypothetical protein